MPVIANARHEAFARNITAGATQAEAARQAGFADGSAKVTGSQLMKRPEIQARIQELQADAATATVQHAAVTRDAVLAEIWWNVQASRAANDRTNHNRATELLGKSIALFRENLLIDDPNGARQALSAMPASVLMQIISWVDGGAGPDATKAEEDTVATLLN